MTTISATDPILVPNWWDKPAAQWRAITLKGPWDLPIVAPYVDERTAFRSLPAPVDREALPPPKLCENRVWSTTWRGPLVISSGTGWDVAAESDPHVQAMWRAVCPGLVLRRQMWTWAGHVTAVAQLVDCHPAQPGCCPPWGQYGARVFHLSLADVRALTEPVRARGAERLWKPDADLVEQIRRRIPC